MTRDRSYYSTLSTDELKRLLRQVEARTTTAFTMSAALTDCFTQQEIYAVLTERGE